MIRPVSLFRLIDGPLIDQAARREDLVRRMATDLIEAGALAVRDDAIDVLMARGYPTFDIFSPRMVDDAMQAAAQELVAMEMSRP